MNSEVIKALTEKACVSIRYRTRKEILEEGPDIVDYLDEILNDKRVKYVFTWQRADGYLGLMFHGGSIDVPPGNDTRYNIVKGGIDGQKKVHAGTNHQ